MNDPDVVLTDLGLSVLAAFLGWRLWTRPRRDALQTAATVLMGGLASAALFGAIFHGLFPAGTATRAGFLAWIPVALSMLVVSVVLVDLTLRTLARRLPPPVRATILVLYALSFAAVMLLVDESFITIVRFYAPALVLFLVAAIKEGWRLIAGGFTLSGGAAILQQAGVAVHPVYFDHNAVYHVVLAIALVFIYLGFQADAVERTGKPGLTALPQWVRAIKLPVAWRTPAREFLVIVAGVLAALAAQAWWQSREERKREGDYLRQLLVDTRENEHRLDEAIAGDSTSQQIMLRLSRALYGPGPPPPSDSLVALFSRAFNMTDFRPLSGTYGALVAAGDLRLIGTDSLRTGLVAYAARLENAQSMLAFFFQQAFGDPGRIATALPFMRRAFSANLAALQAEARNTGFRVERARNDPDVAAAIFAWQAANSNRLVHLRSLREETRHLRRLLELEPAARSP